MNVYPITSVEQIHISETNNNYINYPKSYLHAHEC
jgi:hypothetical protein